MTYSHDVIVIGGGAAGLTAAGGCALFGLKTALIEAGKMGGECLNNGCVPSKAVIAAARRAAETRVSERFGVHLEAAKVDWAGVHKHVHDTIGAIEPHDSQETFEEMGCEVFRDWATLTGPNTVQCGDRELSAPRIVLALGSEPAVPPIEGLEEVPYLTNESLFDLAELPEHLVIIGGGVIGMEMGQSFCRLGSEVTIISPRDLMSRDDRDSVALLKEVMEEEGVKFVTGRAAKAQNSVGGITVTTNDDASVTGSHLLIATGRRARVDGMGLEDNGIKIGRDGIEVDERRRSSLKHIYAIGDCRSGPRLTHAAGYEGSRVVLEIALGLPSKVDYRALPWCTYTSPEVAQIGLTEAGARAKYGDQLTIVKEDYSHNERAMTEGETRGHVKLMLKGKKVVGASICGINAGELLLPYSMMITGKSGTFDIGGAIISYPTLSEITKAAAFKAWEPTLFGKWPKKWVALVAKMRRAF